MTWKQFWLPVLFDIVCTVSAFLLYKNIIKKDIYKSLYIFLMLLLSISIGIHLHLLIPLDMTVADHWFIIAMIGVLGVLGVLTRCWSMDSRLKKIGIGVVCIIVILLGWTSYWRSLDWKNGLTLYTHDLRYAKDNFDIQNNIAHAFVQEKRFEEALPHAKRAVELVPTYWVSWNTLGAILLNLGDVDGALAAYQRSMQYSEYAKAHENTVATLLLYKDPAQAAAFARIAVGKFPANVVLWTNFAFASYAAGNQQEAIVAIDRAYKLNPTIELQNLGNQMRAGLPINIVRK
jgi:tetratricopeptide (TPR) repeat protein